MAILRRTERAMVRAMCGAKWMEKKRTEDLMETLGLKETVVQMAKENGVRWYGHVLRRDDGHVLRYGNWRDCCQSGVNLANPVYWVKPGSKLELMMIDNY